MYKLLFDNLKNEVRTDFLLKLTNNLDEQVFVPMLENNTDYQQYLKWVAEGNTPEPANEPSA